MSKPYKNFELNYKKDRTGFIFQLLEDMGSFPYIAYGLLRKSSGQPEWVFLPHSRYDGVGGFYYLLWQNGYEVSELPQIKDKTIPSFLKKINLFLKLMKEERNNKIAPGGENGVKWKHYDDSQKMYGQSCCICWHVFNENDTNKLIASAKANQVSFNSLLLWSLKQSLYRSLISDSDFGDKMWWIPINMRGQIKGLDPTSNQSTSMKIALSRNISAKNRVIFCNF